MINTYKLMLSNRIWMLVGILTAAALLVYPPVASSAVSTFSGGGTTRFWGKQLPKPSPPLKDRVQATIVFTFVTGPVYPPGISSIRGRRAAIRTTAMLRTGSASVSSGRTMKSSCTRPFRVCSLRSCQGRPPDPAHWAWEPYTEDTVAVPIREASTSGTST